MYKRLVVISILMFVMSLIANAQIGTWSGTLHVQEQKLSLVFHPDDENPTMGSPDQIVRGIPVQVEKSGVETLIAWLSAMQTAV